MENYLALLVLFASVVATCTGHFSALWRADISISNTITEDYMMHRFSNYSSLMCADACRRMSCESFFFTTPTRTCQLHSFVFPRHTSLMDGTSSPGTKYYHRAGRQIPCHGNSVAGLSKEYFIPSQVEKRWTGAFKKCQSMGGVMATIPDQATSSALTPFIEGTFGSEKMSSALWVNARVSQSAGSFVWCDSKDVIPNTSPLWYINQPDYYNNPTSMTPSNKTECVILVPAFQYRLDDYACENGKLSAKLYPLCVCP